MKIVIRLILFFGLFLFDQIAYCQENIDFVYNEIEVTIFPNEPGICPNSSTDVACLESFESYKWEMVDPHPQFTILYGQAQELEFPGEYKLTVEKYINNKLCVEEVLFEVHDLQSSSGIENYFIKNGFYSVPVVINQSGLIKEGESNSRGNCDLEAIKFSNEFGFIDLDADTYVSDIINDFKPFSNDDYDAVEVKSENSCICEIGIDELEDSFYSNSLAIWAHLFAENESDASGKLYIKGMIPFEGEVPKNEEQFGHLESIHATIISDDQNNADASKASFEHLRIILSNLVMPNPTGGYNLDTQCQIPVEEVEDSHVFTPGQIAIELPPDANNLVFENNISNLGFGSLLKFNSFNKSWQNYHRDEDFVISNGYFNPINAEFFESFTTSISECNDCVLEISSIEIGCELSCSIETEQYSSQYFDLNGVGDGGFDYDISSCNSSWNLWPITKRASRELIYELLCSMKSGDEVFEFDEKFKDKVIFAKNITLGDITFEYVGVTMPKEESFIEFLDEPLLNFDSNVPGFINSFEISENSDVRLNFLKLGVEIEEEVLGAGKFKTNRCKNILGASYSNIKWQEKSTKISDCLEYYKINEKYKLLDYLDPPDQENLLILVNGYRILMAPGEKWYKGGVEFPKQHPEDAINPCYDNYEAGNYWGDMGARFAEHINKNIIFVDGHNSITTSNHKQMIGENLIQTSFLNSLISCFPYKFFYYCAEVFCGLNHEPNPAGFLIRYLDGIEAGFHIWNKMITGEIQVELSNDESRITGKIDVVAHSMGYAYSKGMIDYLANHLEVGNTFGNYYIIAPENAGAYSDEEFEALSIGLQEQVEVDLNLFESVFQYGSNFNPGGDTECKQDGVAPQKRVRGLNENNENNVFIPDTEEKNKKFVNAHLMENYGWIFKIEEDEKGHIQKRE